MIEPWNRTSYNMIEPYLLKQDRLNLLEWDRTLEPYLLEWDRTLEPYLLKQDRTIEPCLLE